MTWVDLIANCWLDDEKEYNVSTTDQFIYDLKRSIFEDDLYSLLNYMNHYFDHCTCTQLDDDFRRGNALRLVHCLQQCLIIQHYDPISSLQDHTQNYQLDKVTNQRKYHIRHPNNNNDDTEHLERNNRALQVTVLCTAIDRMIQCHDDILVQHGNTLASELSTCLPHVIQLFTKKSTATTKPNHDHDNDTNKLDYYTTTALVTLSTCIRIMKRISSTISVNCGVVNVRFLTTLLRLIQENVRTILPTDILIDATFLITQLITTTTTEGLYDNIEPKQSIMMMTPKMIENSNTLLSILSTAAAVATTTTTAITSTSDSLNRHHQQQQQILLILDGLLHLAKTSPKIRIKFIRLRCTVLAILTHVTNNNNNIVIQKKALHLLRLMIQGMEITMTEASCVVYQSNIHLILVTLLNILPNSLHLETGTLIVFALNDMITKKCCLSLKQTCEVMDALYNASITSDATEIVTMEAAVAYLYAAGKLANIDVVLLNVVYYIMSPFAKVRSRALWLLTDISYWNTESAKCLVFQTDVLQNFSIIINHGSDQDCQDVIYISKQLIVLHNQHVVFCQTYPFLAALVEMVTTTNTTTIHVLRYRRTVYKTAVDVLLALISHEQCTSYFLNFHTLLPWMVKVANTTLDNGLKSDLVKAIIEFSTAILEKSSEI